MEDSISGLRAVNKLKVAHTTNLSKKKMQFFYALAGIVILVLIAVILAYGFYQKRKTSNQLEEKNSQIRSALKDKDILLKEVNHRVKNNMQMVSGLLQLKAKGTIDEVAKAALMDSHSRIYSMSLAHQRMYESENY